MQEFRLFPTLVLQSRNFIDNDEAKTIYDTLLESNEAEDHIWLSGNALSSSWTKNPQVISKFDFLTDRFKKALQQYADTAGLASLKMHRSWYNIQNKESELLYHSHSPSVVSGALYINVAPGSSGIVFHNDGFYNRNYCWYANGGHTEYTQQEREFPVETGMLMMFPSNLRHRGTHNSTNNRMVVSFDTMFDLEEDY